VLEALVIPLTAQLTDRRGVRVRLALSGGLIALAPLPRATRPSLTKLAVAFNLARLADPTLAQTSWWPTMAQGRPAM